MAINWNLAVLLVLAPIGTAWCAEEGLSPAALHGREIYRRGTRGGIDAGTAAIGAGGVPLPSSTFTCANCHGIWGGGAREGGVSTPPLNWSYLTSPAVSALTGRWRGAYSLETLRKAITAGRDPAGRPLHAGMPRFQMLPERLSEVVAYLERLGDPEDTDAGVSPTRIRIGAALPLSGPLAEAGRSIRETLELLFAGASRGGGIFGRGIELAVEDSGTDAPGRRSATRRLIEDRGVFALAASLEPNSTGENAELLKRAFVPLIGPVGFSPHNIEPPNPVVFYLLPNLYDQTRSLVDFAVARDPGRRPCFAVIYGGAAVDGGVVDGLRRQTRTHGLTITAAERDGPGVVATVLATNPDYLVFAGDGIGLVRVAKQMDRDSAPVLMAFLSTAESGVSQLPQRVADRALYASPAPPPDPRHAEAFFTLLGAAKPPQNLSGIRASAFAAGTVLLAALRSNGDRLSRDSLVRALERLQQFETGVLAPLTFGPNQHIGSGGAAILGFDKQSQSLVPVSGWVAPKN